MKKAFSFITLALSICLILAACGAANTDPANKVDPSVIGAWYGPAASVKLDINSNGTGTVTLSEANYAATFTADNGVFTANCEAYYLQGAYEASEGKLIVKVEHEGTEYTVIFTREVPVMPENLVGTHVYILEEIAYEIIIESNGGGWCRGLPYPPSADFPETKIYITPGGDVYPHPPTITNGSGLEHPTGNTENTPTESSGTAPSNATNTSAPNTETSEPSNSAGSGNTPAQPEYIPKKVTAKEDGKITVTTPDGQEQEATKGGGSIVGTWVSDMIEGHAYVYGHYSGSISMKYVFTFNADGTGSVIAGIFPGTMTYTLTGNRLDLTITMLGQTKSGTGYVTIIGDVCYLENLDREVYQLTRQG